MSALPKQIQNELEEAERIRKQMEQPPEPPVEPTVDTPPAEPTEPVAVTPPAEPVEPPKDAAYWEHRFKTVDGMAKAERARFEEQLRSQTEQLRLFQTQLDSMRQQPPTPPQPEQPLVSDKDEDKFGADLLDVARRVSREELRPLMKRLDAIEAAIKNVAPKVERVAKVEQEVAQNREDRFWTELEAAVPDYQTINADKTWLAWLTEYDAIAGRTRQASLREAQETLDHRRVIALFKLFKGTQAPAPQQKAQKSELARQVAPAKNSTVTAPPQQAKTYTGQDYAYWLDPRRYNDKPLDQITAMKAELEKAFTENRIQW